MQQTRKSRFARVRSKSSDRQLILDSSLQKNGASLKWELDRSSVIILDTRGYGVYGCRGCGQSERRVSLLRVARASEQLLGRAVRA